MKWKAAIVIALAGIIALIPSGRLLAEDNVPTGTVGTPYTFHGNPYGADTSGEQETDIEISTGSGDVAAESEETKQNRQALNAFDAFFQGATTGQFSQINGQNIYVETVSLSREELIGMIAAYPFDPAGYGNETDGADRNPSDNVITPGDEEQAILDAIISGNDSYFYGSLDEEGGARKSKGGRHTGTIMLNGIERITWPELTLSKEEQASVDAFRSDFLLGGGYEVPGYGPLSFIDMTSQSDRYAWLDKWLQGQYAPASQTGKPADGGATIRDTISVQHVVEYRIDQMDHRITYQTIPVPYTDGAGGYYRWDIVVEDCSYPEAIGSIISVDQFGNVLSTTLDCSYVFNNSGSYLALLKANLKNTIVDSLTYSMLEYWVVPETGQIIYKRTSIGNLGDKQSEAGRLEDFNTAYYRSVTEPAPSNAATDGSYGTVVDQQYVLVTEDALIGTFPNAGVTVEFGTVREK